MKNKRQCPMDPHKTHPSATAEGSEREPDERLELRSCVHLGQARELATFRRGERRGRKRDFRYRRFATIGLEMRRCKLPCALDATGHPPTYLAQPRQRRLRNGRDATPHHATRLSLLLFVKCVLFFSTRAGPQSGHKLAHTQTNLVNTHTHLSTHKHVNTHKPSQHTHVHTHTHRDTHTPVNTTHTQTRQHTNLINTHNHICQHTLI